MKLFSSLSLTAEPSDVALYDSSLALVCTTDCQIFIIDYSNDILMVKKVVRTNYCAKCITSCQGNIFVTWHVYEELPSVKKIDINGMIIWIGFGRSK